MKGYSVETVKRFIDHCFGLGLLLDLMHWIPAAVSFAGSLFAMVWYGARLYEYFKAKRSKTALPEE